MQHSKDYKFIKVGVFILKSLYMNIFFHQLFLPKYAPRYGGHSVALCFMLRAHLAFCLQTSAFTGTFEASSSKGLSLEVLPISLIKTNQTIFKRSTFYQYCNFGKLSNLGGKTDFPNKQKFQREKNRSERVWTVSVQLIWSTRNIIGVSLFGQKPPLTYLSAVHFLRIKGCVIFSELLRLRGKTSTRENAANSINSQP